MFTSFAKNLYFSLVENGFGLIKNMHDTDQLSNATKYMGFSKSAGSMLYIVFIVNLDNMELDNYKDIFDDYSTRLENNATTMNIRNIYISNILVGDKLNLDAKELAYLQDPFCAQLIYSTYFHAILSESCCYSGIKDKDDFLNIKEQVNKSFGTDALVIPEKFESLRQKEVGLTSLTPVRYDTYAIFFLIIVNIVMMILMELSGGSQNIQVLEVFGALMPTRVFDNQEFYRLFSAIFLHIGMLHLTFNCLSLYIFGKAIEKHMGLFKFVVIYLASGFFGNFLSLFFVPQISAGASGAVFGIIGALLAITKKTGKSIEGFSKSILVSCIVMNLAFGILAFNINNYAHIGGLLSGYIMGFLLYKEVKSEKEGITA